MASTLGPCTVVEPYSCHRLIHYGDYIIQPAAFFTRQAYEAVGGLDKSLHWAMDWDLWIRLARRYPVVYIEKHLASYRWLGSNKTAEGGFDRLEEIETVARRYGCNGLPAYFRLEKARLFAVQAKRNLKAAADCTYAEQSWQGRGNGLHFVASNEKSGQPAYLAKLSHRQGAVSSCRSNQCRAPMTFPPLHFHCHALLPAGGVPGRGRPLGA